MISVPNWNQCLDFSGFIPSKNNFPGSDNLSQGGSQLNCYSSAFQKNVTGEGRIMGEIRLSVGMLICMQAFCMQAEAATPTLGVVEVRAGLEVSNQEQSSPSASRLGVTLKEIPASVEIVDRHTISDHGKRQIVEAVEMATGMSGGTNGSTPLTVQTRGFTRNAVRYLYDGIDLGSANTTGRQGGVFNLERIEVLRGPASVLHGDGAMGGVLNFVTKAPSRRNDGVDVEVGMGSYETTRYGIGTGGIIADKAAYYRVDMSGMHAGDGAYDTGKDFGRFTSSLLFDITERLSASFHLDYAKDRTSQFYFGTPLRDGKIDPSLSKINYNTVVGDAFRSENTLARAIVQWRPNNAWDIKNTAYYSAAHRDWRNLDTFVLNSATNRVSRSFSDLDHDQTDLGNRLELLNKSHWFGHDNRLAFGIEMASTGFQSHRNGFLGSDTVDAYNPPTVLASSLPGVRYRTTGNDIRDVTIDKTSYFIDDQFSLTSQLKLVAGARHDKISTKFRYITQSGETQRNPSFSATSSRLGVVYEALPWLTLYAQYSNATEPVNTLLLLSSANTAFDLTKAKQFEVGTKSSFLNGAAELTTAVYQIDKRNVLTRDSANPNNTIAVGKQSSLGFELAAAYRPSLNWMFDGNIAIVKAKFDDFSERVGSVAVSRNGNRPTDVPAVLANLGVRHYFDAGFYLGGYARYVGKRYINAANTLEMPGYTTLDLTVGYKLDKKTDLSFWVRNATNKLYAQWSDGSAGPTVQLGDPRTVELVLRSTF